MTNTNNTPQDKKIERLEKIVANLERRVIYLEKDNKKMRSALSAAQSRINTLVSSIARSNRE